jgi:hypothetical protein
VLVESEAFLLTRCFAQLLRACRVTRVTGHVTGVTSPAFRTCSTQQQSTHWLTPCSLHMLLALYSFAQATSATNSLPACMC